MIGIKIVYEEGESGWAVDLGDGQARISNLPIANNLNIDDVVSLKTVNGRRWVDKVLSRTFFRKTSLEYDMPYKKNYRAIWETLRTAGMKVEGLMAHQRDQDPVAVCEAAGIEVRLYEAQPKLADIGMPS
jgi:hypothetical protein